MDAPTRTQVAIVGAGPAGLMLSHLLHREGIDSIVVDDRSRPDIEATIRAGILENGTVDLLVESGASDRVLIDGHRHDGIELQFEGEGHRIDFRDLVGRSVWLYPQHEVLKDLLARRFADGGDIRLECTAQQVVDENTDEPRVVGVDAAGQRFEIVADFVIGADGSRSIVRSAVSESRTGYFREYPFAWFGILCTAPPSASELIYANSESGFALISQRSETVQRMYLQCDPDLDPQAMTDAEIWDALQSRVAGTELKQGEIFQRDVLRFRSFVAQRLQNRRVLLIGDAAHTVPPTGAKGMNLAVHDVQILLRGIVEYYAGRGTAVVDDYERTALRRIWRAQNFSWWMTSMLHVSAESTEFDRRRQLGELESIVSSRAAQTYLAEGYTGWPAEEEAR